MQSQGRSSAGSAPIFVTAVFNRRIPFLRYPRNKHILLSSLREIKKVRAFSLFGYVLLDDHFHFLLLPAKLSDLPSIMQSVKLRLATRISTRTHDRDLILQLRYWHHVMQDGEELRRHLDYIHYDPVHHGYAQSPLEYTWSSYQEHHRRGRYPDDWGTAGLPESLRGLAPE